MKKPTESEEERNSFLAQMSKVDAEESKAESKQSVLKELSGADDKEEGGLYPYQVEAYDELIKRYMNPLYSTQLLPAATGWGKTYLATQLAKYLWTEFKMKPFIVCPATLRLMWQKSMQDAKVPYAALLSYDEIRGIRGKVIAGEGDDEVRGDSRMKHPWLVRENGKTGPFYATDKFRDACFSGLFMIFDEVQATKNDSAQHWACFELVSSALCFESMPVMQEIDGQQVPTGEVKHPKVRVLHLSAATYAEDSCRKNFFRMMGLVTDRTMFQQNPGTGQLEWKQHGLGTCYDKGLMINEALTKRIFARNVVSANGLPKLLEDLWDNLFQKVYSVPVVDPIYKDKLGRVIPHIRQNGFYLLNDEAAAECASAIARLKRAHVLQEDGGVNMVNANSQMALIQSALMALAHAKTSDILRVALEDLRTRKSCKLILCIPFREDQAWLVENLSMYHPLVLNGDVKFADRTKITDAFNAPNLKHRVMIMTPTVGGLGISLHDHREPSDEDMKSLTSLFSKKDDALFPRRTYLVPTFHFLAMFQAAGRGYRGGLRSEVFVCFFYGSNAPLESVLVNTMIKSGVASGIAGPGTGRMFPNQYDFYIENEGPQHKPLREMLTKVRNMSKKEIQDGKKAL